MKQKYQIQTVTPVHIGSGETLNQIDGYYANGRWYHIDLDRVLAHPSTDLNALTSDMGKRGFRWERHLRQRSIDPAALSAYNLPCPQSPEEVEIREAIKTVDNRPFMPGSTLNGALRTALLSELIDADGPLYEDSLAYLKNLTRQQGRGNPRRERPAQKIERDALGRDPNRDLLRALKISDTAPLESDALEIGMAWTVTLNQKDQLVQKVDRGREYKNFVQQIQAGQRLTFTLKIDELLLREREKARLGFTDLQEEKLRDIAEVCRSEADQFMQDEQDFFDYYNLPQIANFYDKLIHLNNMLPEGAFLLQIGWGTGYHANTVMALFLSNEESGQASPEVPFMDKQSFRDLREHLHLGESRARRGRYDTREFPKTRRILYRGQNPICPLGWVKISPIEEVGAVS